MELTTAQLAEEFDATGPRYDAMVSRNPGYHEQLRTAAQIVADSLPRHGTRTVVDLGCGSGASTAALTDAVDAQVQIVGVDNSAGMLGAARAKSWPPTTRFVHGAAGELAARGAEWELPAQVDAVLACYLFRNVVDPDAALSDVYDALVPGGTLVVQDYTLAGSVRAALTWTLVCWLVVIPLSLVLTRRTRLYRYLWHSVLRFDAETRFRDRLVAAGFAPVSVQQADGWQRGVLHTFVAVKPLR